MRTKKWQGFFTTHSATASGGLYGESTAQTTIWLFILNGGVDVGSTEKLRLSAKLLLAPSQLGAPPSEEHGASPSEEHGAPPSEEHSAPPSEEHGASPSGQLAHPLNRPSKPLTLI
jgi:hypothetical protein